METTASELDLVACLRGGRMDLSSGLLTWSLCASLMVRDVLENWLLPCVSA